MVKVVEGGAWRGSALLTLLGAAAIANACGGRTVWVDETADAGESGGVSGRGGDYGGGYAGDDYGGGGYTGGYGGDYGGTYGGTYGGAGYTGGVSGAYGGGPVTGGYGGTYGGGPVTGGYGGTYGGGPVTGGVAGKGGFGGSAGVTGKGGCGAASGTGGSSGSPALFKACSLFCARFPYSSCPTDLEGPADCISQCRAGFGFGSWCEAPLTNFLMCAGQALDPNALCDEQGEGLGSCSGPGCFDDAVFSCAFEYNALSECAGSPRPLPPCPPPPDRPLPPGCSQSLSWDTGFCARETFCASGEATAVDCSYLYDSGNTWACQCYTNGFASGSLTTSGTTGDACREAAAICGVY